MEWPKYRSHKVIMAARIAGFDTRDTGGRVCAMVDPGDGEYVTFTPSVGEMLERANVGDYAVIYDNGYGSISPAKEFEEGYTPCQTPTETT
jgi:hypothetical protein